MWSPWLAKADASLYAKNVRQYMLEKHRELEFLASFEPPDGRGQNWLPLIQKIPKALPVGHPWWKIYRCGQKQSITHTPSFFAFWGWCVKLPATRWILFCGSGWGPGQGCWQSHLMIWGIDQHGFVMSCSLSCTGCIGLSGDNVCSSKGASLRRLWMLRRHASGAAGSGIHIVSRIFEGANSVPI